MKGRRILFLSVLFAVVITALLSVPAFAKPLLKKKQISVAVGESVQLEVTGTKKKVKWSSSDKKIATVSNKGVVKGRKTGKVTIKAKIGKNTLKCNLTVTNANSSPVSIGSSLLTGQENGNTNVGSALLIGEENGSTNLVFHQDGWYVARLEAQLYNKQTQEYSWIHSDSCAKGEKATVKIETNTYDIARIGFQIWYFGWDNFYFNFPYRYANGARDFTLTGYGDYPKFTWS